MKNTKERITRLVDELKQERDELRLKLQLAKMEAGDEWQELDAKWEKFESKARAVGNATAESADEIGVAAKLLGEEIRDGFKRIARQL